MGREASRAHIRHRKELENSSAAGYTKSAMGGRHVILVVDDDADIREALSAMLGEEGYDVLAAADGQEALEKLEAGARPTVIVLDLMMPRMNGFDFLERVRESDDLRRIPVVVLSANRGYQRDDLRVYEVLRKPSQIDRILDVLEQASAN